MLSFVDEVVNYAVWGKCCNEAFVLDYLLEEAFKKEFIRNLYICILSHNFSTWQCFPSAHVRDINYIEPQIIYQ